MVTNMFKFFQILSEIPQLVNFLLLFDLQFIIFGFSYHFYLFNFFQYVFNITTNQPTNTLGFSFNYKLNKLKPRLILSSTKTSSLKYLLKSNVQKDQLIILWKTKRRKKTKKTKTKLSPSVLQYLRQPQTATPKTKTTTLNT